MKNFLLVFSILLIFSACSTTSNNDTTITLPDDGGGSDNGNGTDDGGGTTNDNNILPDGVIGTGDSVLDEGLRDALRQLKSVRGFTQWTWQSNGVTIDGSNLKRADHYFFSNNIFRYVSTTSYDGKGFGVVFYNEIVRNEADQGTFTAPSAPFTIRNFNNANITAELTNEGYKNIYIFAHAKSRCWVSKKLSGPGVWTNGVRTGYYPNLAKINDTSMGFIILDGTSGANEYILSKGAFGGLRDAQVFQKK
ncbi:MAG: hypothetical protein ACRCWI_05665 [Brevinema sp.]